MVVSVWAGERRLAGVVGGRSVRTRSTGLGADSLPAASRAATWKAYSRPGTSPASLQVVPATSSGPLAR